MTRLHTFAQSLAVGMVLGFVLSYPGQAEAIKYMGLKEAIKHFLPSGATLSKVKKTLPADQVKALKKKYALNDTVDFKHTLDTGPHEIYVGRGSDGKAKIYIFIVEQIWRTCYHQFAVGVSPDGKIVELAAMDLPCPYQRPIAKKSFLNQFTGKKGTSVQLGKGIDAVTGATASSETATIVARRALALYEAFFANAK